MAELFGVQTPAISKHLKNIFEEKELDETATISKMETVQLEGNHQITRLYTKPVYFLHFECSEFPNSCCFKKEKTLEKSRL